MPFVPEKNKEPWLFYVLYVGLSPATVAQWLLISSDNCLVDLSLEFLKFVLVRCSALEFT